MRLNFKLVLTISLLALCLGWGTPAIYAQNWSNLAFTLNSTHGNNNCHNPDQDYNLQYNVNIPANTSSTADGTRVVETYVLEEIRIADNNQRFSIRSGVGNIDLNIQPLGSESSGSITVRYFEDWQETDLSFVVFADIRYKRTRAQPDGNGGYGTPVTEIDYTSPRSSDPFIFPLGDFLTAPTSILINGVSSSNFEVDGLQGCQDYTLNAGVVEGVDRYRWEVSPSSILLSGTASLTTNTIQVRPTFGNIVSTINLVLIQDCDGVRSKSNSFTVTTEPVNVTIDRRTVCETGAPTQLSVPAFGNGVYMEWFYNSSKVDLISGQNTNSIQLQAVADHQEPDIIYVGAYSTCGGVVGWKDIWIGTPAMPDVNPAGYPVIQMTHQGFRSLDIINPTDHQEVTVYDWSATPNNVVSLFHNNWRTCVVEAINVGNANVYVTPSNVCGVGTTGGWGINVTGSGGGIPDPKSLQNSKLTTAEAIKEFNLQPNPATDRVRLSLFNSQGTIIDVKGLQVDVLDLNGRVIASPNRLAVDVSEFPAGIYLVRINTGEEMLSQKLVVK